MSSFPSSPHPTSPVTERSPLVSVLVETPEQILAVDAVEPNFSSLMCNPHLIPGGAAVPLSDCTLLSR